MLRPRLTPLPRPFVLTGIAFSLLHAVVPVVPRPSHAVPGLRYRSARPLLRRPIYQCDHRWPAGLFCRFEEWITCVHIHPGTGKQWDW